jgi:hypothetical protein
MKTSSAPGIRLIRILAAGLLLSTLSLTSAFGSPNAVVNGDFDQGLVVGWTTGVVSGTPLFDAVFLQYPCPPLGFVPSGRIIVNAGADGYLEQAVTLSASPVLSLEAWGDIAPTIATISIIGADNSQHIIDVFTPPVMFTGTNCTGNVPVTKVYDLAAFSGLPVKLRMEVAGGTNSATWPNVPRANFNQVSILETQNFIYIMTNGGITITVYTGTNSAVSIPSQINNLPVTAIGDNAFGWHTELTSVTIPDSVTNIGAAFVFNTSLTTISVQTNNPAYSSAGGVLFDKSQATLIQYPIGNIAASYGIPASVVNIGDSAFAYSTNLTSVTIPDNVTSIGNYAFFSCASLKNATIGNGVTNIGDGAFQYSGLTSVSIPNSVTSIGEFTFAYSTSLTSITINSTVIGSYDFRYCTSLTNLTMGNSVTSIGDVAFAGCTSLTSLTINNGVASIGDGAFEFCGMTNVTIPNSVTNFGQYVFYGCSNLTAISVETNNPDYSSLNGVLFDKSQITLIEYPPGNGATSYAIPNSVANIGNWAFEALANLTNITIPYGVTNIGDEAFGYGGLTTVIIPDRVTSIGSYAFNQCTNLMTITIGNSVTSIGDQAFNYCTNLTSVIIPNSVANIGDWAFASCASLTNVTIPNSVTNLGDGAFTWCANLTNISIGNGVISIGADAFASSGLMSVAIPNSVTNIGHYAFNGCVNLTHVAIGNAVTSIAEGTFDGCANLTSVSIPNSVASIGFAAFVYCTGLTNVTIPNSVTNLGDLAFGECTNLSSLYFQGDAPNLDGTSVFLGDNVTIYYLPGTSGWGPIFGGVPTMLWTTFYPLILNRHLGIQTNQFGFTVSWATNLSVIVDATVDLKNPNWLPLTTNVLNGGTFSFTDPQWMNYPVRFYRVHSQ